MNRPLPAGLPASTSPLAEYGQIARTDRRPQRSKPLMRKYEVAYLAPNSDGMSASRLAPATPMFESAFMAYARGTLITTSQGQVAVEDLFPGMMIETVDSGIQPLMWMGSTTIVPGAPGQSPASSVLTRIAPDAMGFGRPAQDLLLGFAARMFRTNTSGAQLGQFESASTLIDGMNAISVRPPSPVRVFHLALREHSRIIANGMEVESFHPGHIADRAMRPEMRNLYTSLFPHIRTLDEFGPMRFTRRNAEEPATADTNLQLF